MTQQTFIQTQLFFDMHECLVYLFVHSVTHVTYLLPYRYIKLWIRYPRIQNNAKHHFNTFSKSDTAYNVQQTSIAYLRDLLFVWSSSSSPNSRVSSSNSGA